MKLKKEFKLKRKVQIRKKKRKRKKKKRKALQLPAVSSRKKYMNVHKLYSCVNIQYMEK